MMKRTILTSLIAGMMLMLAGVGHVSAKPVTRAERKAAVKYLKHTQKLFLDSVKGLSDAQLKWKPADDKWSVFEVAEHIALSEKFLFDIITGQVMTSPADATKTTAVTMDQIMKQVPDRTNKFQAPEPIRPDKSPWGSMSETMSAFKQRRATTIGFVEKGNDDMRERFFMNPAFNTEVDAYLWIAFLSAHTERHVKQILEVRSHADFPKK